MKLSAVLTITVAYLLMSIRGNSQSVTFSQDNVSLEVIFAAIQKQTPYHFFIDHTLMKQARKVSLHVVNTPLLEVLDIVFKEQPFTYSIFDKVITAKAREAIPPTVQKPNWITIQGRVISETGDPIARATISAKGSNRQTASTENGYFSLGGVLENDSLEVTSIGFLPEELKIQGVKALRIELKTQATQLSGVTVIVSNGYQKQSTTKSTGSYFKVDSALFNRRPSTFVLERLDGVSSGVMFNKNIQSGTNQSSFSIRGRSTIYANPEPLIILDNFPYTGDITNINPNDVESMTILKDAAAAAIWGAYAGNGVIVITTKTGKYNQPLRLSVNSNITIGAKPDLYYQPILSSSDYIDVENFLFTNGFYTERESSPLHVAISPAVEVMIKQRDRLISGTEAQAQLDVLRRQDTRKDLDKYFYRTSANQQYSLNLSGGGTNNQYYFSAGYDKNLSNQVGNQYDRLTLNANNTYAWLNRKLELSTGIIFSATKSQGDNSFGVASTRYPYLKLADDNGNALAVTNYYRLSYLDTVGQGKLLDWQYRPLDELHLTNNKTNVSDYRINVGLKYNIVKDLSANFLYQYNKGFSRTRNLYDQSTYFVRNLINVYTQINGNTVTRPIPLGAILDKSDVVYEAHNARGQINYNHSWGPDHSLNLIGGAEIRSLEKQISTARLYGYNPTRESFAAVDYVSTFASIVDFSPKVIPFLDQDNTTRDHYISYYTNGAYTFKQRYTLSASIRKDESNIFGVKTNQKGVPLWSAALAWEVSQEKFYGWNTWLPYLKFRVSNGYNGNVDRSVSAFTTATTETGVNSWGALFASIANPPNPALRWEKVHMVNLGVDFATINNRVSGSLEYYYRKASDLIGNSPLDPTTGNSTLRGNTADMSGKGVDITLVTINTKGKLEWSSNILFSYNKDKVTEYKVQLSTILDYLNPDFFRPLKGRPLYSISSFEWKGLDPSTGDPQGIQNDTISKNYGAIITSTDFSQLKYRGAQNPTFFGSFRNTFSWKQLQLSFNITWKAGYYFRAPSIMYYDLFNDRSKGHADYSNRWQKPGDETKTNVPSIRYVTDNNRDNFYKYSDILVERADHVRLQDIQLNYTIKAKNPNKSPVQSFRLYAYVNNIGLLWKATDKDIDPDYSTGLGQPNPRTYTIGINIDLK